MAKLVGYILAVLGLVVIILSLNLSKLGFNLPASIKAAYVMIAGIVLLILGIFLVIGKGSKATSQSAEEVPIYHGNKIVGYRRQK